MIDGSFAGHQIRNHSRRDRKESGQTVVGIINGTEVAGARKKQPNMGTRKWHPKDYRWLVNDFVNQQMAEIQNSSAEANRTNNNVNRRG